MSGNGVGRPRWWEIVGMAATLALFLGCLFTVLGFLSDEYPDGLMYWMIRAGFCFLVMVILAAVSDQGEKKHFEAENERRAQWRKPRG